MEKLKSDNDQAEQVYEISYELYLHRNGVDDDYEMDEYFYEFEHITDTELKYLGEIWKNLKSLRSLELDLPRC